MVSETDIRIIDLQTDIAANREIIQDLKRIRDRYAHRVGNDSFAGGLDLAIGAVEAHITTLETNITILEDSGSWYEIGCYLRNVLMYP